MWDDDVKYELSQVYRESPDRVREDPAHEAAKQPHADRHEGP